MSYRNYSTAVSHIVDLHGQGDFTTIQNAINAAVSGQTIFIRPGTYPEDPVLKAGVSLTAFGSDSSTNGTGEVIISGKCTFTGAGSVTISGIQLQTNSDFLLAVTGSSASVVSLNNCYLNCTNHTGISFTSSSASAKVFLSNCKGDIGTTGISLFAHSSAGTLFIQNCQSFTNSGAATTASTCSAGAVSILSSYFNFPLTSSGTGNISGDWVDINCNTLNTTTLTSGGSGGHTFNHSTFTSGTASAISVSQSILLDLCVITSSNTNAITGAGTVTLSGLAFTSSSTINATTQVGNSFDPGIITSPYQPCFSAFKSSLSSNATGDGTVVSVVFDSTLSNQGTNYNTSTGVFTAPLKGNYLFNSTIMFNNSAAGDGSITFNGKANGANYVLNANQTHAEVTSGNTILNATTIVPMNANDTMAIQATWSGTTKTVNIYGAAVSGPFFSTFCGYMIC